MLGAFAADFQAASIPPAVAERAKWILADCIGVSVAGMREPEMASLVRARLRPGTVGESTVLGTRLRTGARDAAFLNGIAGTWLELDEGNTLAKGHPGIQVVPAALALAQELGSTGEALLGAITLGYEVSSRINRAARIRPIIHPHGTFGVIGAALAIARLKAVPRHDYARLIRLAAALPMAASYRTLDAGATVRNAFTGHSAEMGFSAVDFLEAGFTAEPAAVASTFGEILGEAFTPASAIEGLGTRWMTGEGYFKLYPTARSMHAAIEAVEQAVSSAPGGRIDADTVDSITVTTFRLAADKAQREVSTPFGAKFSIPFAVATFLVHGKATLECFNEAAVRNETVRRLTRLTRVVEDPAMTAAYPARQPCTVAVGTRSGDAHLGHCDIMRGEPGRPNTEAELRAKFEQLTAPTWGIEHARGVFEDCLTLERLSDVRAWSIARGL